MNPVTPSARIACFIALVAGVLFVAGCARPETASPGSSAETPEPVKVSVCYPEQRSLLRVVEQPGTIQPYEETTLYARVSGYLVKVHADIGQEVKKDEVLAEIAVPEMEEEVKQKKALVRQALAEVEQSRKALAAAEAHVVVAEAMITEAKAGVTRAQASYDRWNSEFRRIESMVRNRVLDAQTRDEAQNQFRAAEASRDEARARVTSAQAALRKAAADRDKAKADVQAAEAKVDVAQAEAGRLEAMVAYAKIRAPFNGVVTSRKVHTGDFVQPNGGKGEGLFTVSRRHPVRIVVLVPEADAGLVKDKSEVKLTIDALGGPGVTAAVTRTSWSLMPGSRTLRAEVDLPNKDGRLRPGMYVYAHITGMLPKAWTLPTTAVVKQGDTRVCFLIEKGKAVRTPVQLGRTDGEFIEVLKYERPGTPAKWEEWTGKEQVAMRGLGLTDGQAVE